MTNIFSRAFWKNSWLIICMIFFPLFAAQAKIKTDLTWNTENTQAIEHFLVTNHQEGIAVFDADKTLWGDDLGEAFFRWLIENKKLLNIDYTQDIYAEYEKKLAIDRQEGYTWIVGLMAGLPEVELKKWSADFFKQAFVQKIYHPQKTLISSLQKKGIPVWIVSASNRWIIEAGAAWLNVPASNVIGIDLLVDKGILTNQVKQPVTYKQGKILALQQRTQLPILLASGDSVGDQQLLEQAVKLSLLITHELNQKDTIAMLAVKNKWNRQYFPLIN